MPIILQLSEDIEQENEGDTFCGILTDVEKKFGDAHIRTAQEAIHKMTAGKDHEIEKIKKLAGVQ